MSEEILTTDELEDRTWAILAAAAENRSGDVDELLVTLTWDDLVTVVHATARTCARVMVGPGSLDQLAEQVRGHLMERRAEREGLGDG
ncbi:hypothetical protein ACM614_26950 [Streptomyces sp. 12297]